MEAGRLGSLPARVQRMLASAAWALAFLTVLPAPVVATRAGDLARAASWFPAVGLLVGGLLWAAYSLAFTLFPPLLAATLVVVVWVMLTGALHLDGVADCCDGMAAPVDRERRLEILRDPRVGTFGAVGLFLVLALKLGAVATLTAPLPALVLAPVWARYLLLWVARRPAARPGGMGASFGDALTRRILATASLVPLAILLYWMASGRVWLAVGFSILFVALLMRLAHARLGGVTGDVLGLAVEGVEVAILLAFAAYLPGTGA